MKRFSTLLLTAAVAIASTVSATAQTAEEVINRHVAAIGGEEAWRKVNTMKVTGAIKTQGMEIPVVVTMEHNKGMRAQFSVMGMDNYSIMTPTAGWAYMPAMGQTKPEPATPEQVKQSVEDLDLHGDFIDYAKRGHTVELQGKEDVEGTECFKLRMKMKDGKEKVYYIDPSNYYVVRTVTKTTVDGKEEEAAESFSNYKKLPEGIVMPMSTESPMGPMTYTSIEINTPVDAKTFTPSEG